MILPNSGKNVKKANGLKLLKTNNMFDLGLLFFQNDNTCSNIATY